jgi:hypothetical protein
MEKTFVTWMKQLSTYAAVMLASSTVLDALELRIATKALLEQANRERYGVGKKAYIHFKKA